MSTKIRCREGIYFIVGDVLDDDANMIKDLEDSPLQEIVIDLSHCDRMCSLGLGVLILLQKKLVEKGKTMVLVNPPEFFKLALSTTNLEKFFSIR